MTRLWHGAIAALAAFALVGQTILTIDRDRPLINLFSYFTIESNILVLVAAASVAARPDRGGTAFGILRLGSLVAITITGIVYATVLAGNGAFTGIEWWYDKIFHYVVPALSVLGFLLFRPRTRLDRSALWFLIWPLAWLAYTLIRAGVSDPSYAVTSDRRAPVPYDFLDVDRHGGLAVAVACVVVLLLALGLAWGYLKLSRREVEA
ncbi:Pr6Pr family membrane protein [Aeromicrobium ginsengisoli]|uniref:F420-dependent oxidoreductase n=1 Tax=Aeromicrobium ginsengisoli TaxID=363867 RepID=A0A5M4FC19_9ACTN|nr:Pr6Pr family membrane protein [Aeromicrobium ginsengisoli]KAA1395845.1 F420-dependent oxidoreductase [Aeromicrobium ginsengisoli]